MVDRGKVIKGLECCCGGGMCFHGCPYHEVSQSVEGCTSQLASEALELLKKQKALPIVYQNNEYTGLPMALCPSCGEYLVQFHSGVYGKESKFCYYCGQEVQW